MDISVNLKRRRDSGDSLVEEGNNPPTKKKNSQSQPQQPEEKNEITSSTSATSPNYSSPTTTKKYPSPSHRIPTFPNIIFSHTNLNAQVTFTAPFDGQRFHFASKINYNNKTETKVGFLRSPMCLQ